MSRNPLDRRVADLERSSSSADWSDIPAAERQRMSPAEHERRFGWRPITEDMTATEASHQYVSMIRAPGRPRPPASLSQGTDPIAADAAYARLIA